MLDLVLARNQQGANLQVGGRLRRRTSAMAFSPCWKSPSRSRRSPPRSAHYASRVFFRRGCLSARHFGRSYAAEPDILVEQLKTDEAIAEADTLLLTVPNQLGVDYNAHVIEAILKHVAPGLGWR